MVTDINLGPNASASPSNLAVMGGTLFFNATNGISGTELWRSDGSPAGTVLVADINPGAASSFPYDLTAVGSVLLFRARDGTSGDELWRSDGTTAGTVLASDIRPGSGSSNPDSLTSVSPFVFFTADDGTAGRELWRTALGLPGTTTRVRDINPGAAAGLQAGLARLASAADNVRVLMAANDGVNGNELWVSDGATAGTAMLADVNPGAAGSNPAEFVRVGNRVFFRATHAVSGTELWVVPLGAFGGAGARAFGSGCPGTGNLVPVIAGVGLPVTGDAGFGIRVSQGRASTSAVLFGHFQSGSLALGGGCTFYLGLPVILALVTGTDGAGVATMPLGIPDDPSLVGASAFFQWVLVDPNGAWLNLASMSSGLHVAIGG
jgi:ELWxxDGT repeat protein